MKLFGRKLGINTSNAEDRFEEANKRNTKAQRLSQFASSHLESHSVPSDVHKIPKAVHAAVSPLTRTLLELQSNKYFEWYSGNASLPSENAVLTATLEANGVPVEYHLNKITLFGTSLCLSTESETLAKINLVNAGDEITTAVEENQLMIRECRLKITSNSDATVLKKLCSLCQLAVFEYYSILQSITGILIGKMGLYMSDIHVVMKGSFNFKDWCYIKLPDLGWTRVWCYIDSVSYKKTKRAIPIDSQKGNTNTHRRSVSTISNGSSFISTGSSESDDPPARPGKGKFYCRFYRDSSMKELVCYISDLDFISNIFFMSDNDFLVDSSNKSIVNSLKTIKIIGNVNVVESNFLNENSTDDFNSQNDESVFGSKASLSGSSKMELIKDAGTGVHTIKKDDSHLSLNKEVQTPTSRRTFSANSFNLRSPSSLMSSSTVRSPSSRKSSVSISVKSKKKQLKLPTAIKYDGLMIRPCEHAGMSILPTLIKFIIPIMDVCKIYGRPQHFIADKNDHDSILFGLPQYPNIHYFTAQEIDSMLREPQRIMMPRLHDTPKQNLGYTTNLMTQFHGHLIDLVTTNKV